MRRFDVSKHKVFFAYEGGHTENSDAIKAGVKEFNHYQSRYFAITWEDMEISGKIINKCIMDEIDQCTIFACDLTYMNHNVLFELGYAIAKKKNLLILMNDTIDNSRLNYSNFKILKNVGYETFTNQKHVLSALQKREKINSILLDQLISVDTSEYNIHDVFYITSPIDTQASLELTEMMKDGPFGVIYDNTSEVEYQTLAWYLKSLLQAKAIVIHLLGKDKKENLQKNAEASLYAGIGCGLGKRVLLIAPSPFNAPIDYTDILLEYDDVSDCIAKANDWIEINIKKLDNVTKCVDRIIDDKKLNLLKLGIGCEIAEEEKSELLNYFIEIDAYEKALDRKQSIFVGRKGTGKSAIFIKLESDLDQDTNNYNIILKPDSEELLEHIELSDMYKTDRSKKTFFYTIWKYIFYSKLFLNIYKKAQSKPGLLSSSLETRCNIFYNNNHKLLELNFFGAIREINRIVDGKNIIDDPSVLEIFYNKIMSELQELVMDYYKVKKYFTINIMADNLDKTWNAKNDLSVQTEMILTLLEYSGKFEKEINNITDKAKINLIIFLRKDIFDYVRKQSREPDKLTVKSFEIQWDTHPNLLKKMIEKRFEHVLNITGDKVDKVWQEYFSFGKQEPFDVIKDIVVLRPRDVIYFISKLFESAVNSDKLVLCNDDLLYAIEAYTHFLHNNLIAEMKAEHPKIEEILSNMQQQYGDSVEYGEFRKNVMSHGYNDESIDELVHSLLNKKYMIAYNERRRQKIENVDDINKLYEEKRFGLWRKNRILLIPHSDEFYVKLKRSKYAK